MQEQVNIMVTLDSAYLPPLKVMLTSLRQNNLSLNIKVWLIHTNIPEKQLVELEQFLQQLKMSLTSIKIPADLFKDAPTVERYPKEMYYRLVCGDILPKEVNRVIYLDPDILVINSLEPLWQLDLADNVFAAAVHSGLTNISEGINNIRLGIDHGYYNSGVLLIDVEKARQLIHLNDIYQTIDQHGKWLLLPDQDVMNYLYGKVTKEIPEEIWNYDTRQAATYMTRSLGKANTHWVAENTVVLHYCGKPKPWDSNSNNRFTLLYAHYQQLTKRIARQITE